jgi:hypothetical protein
LGSPRVALVNFNVEQSAGLRAHFDAEFLAARRSVREIRREPLGASSHQVRSGPYAACVNPPKVHRAGPPVRRQARIHIPARHRRPRLRGVTSPRIRGIPHSRIRRRAVRPARPSVLHLRRAVLRRISRSPRVRPLPRLVARARAPVARRHPRRTSRRSDASPFRTTRRSAPRSRRATRPQRPPRMREAPRRTTRAGVRSTFPLGVPASSSPPSVAPMGQLWEIVRNRRFG